MLHTSLLPPHNGHQGKLKPLKTKRKGDFNTVEISLHSTHIDLLELFCIFILTSFYNYLLKDYIIILQFKELLLKKISTLRSVKSKIQTVGKQGFLFSKHFSTCPSLAFWAPMLLA